VLLDSDKRQASRDPESAKDALTSGALSSVAVRPNMPGMASFRGGSFIVGGTLGAFGVFATYTMLKGPTPLVDGNLALFGMLGVAPLVASAVFLRSALGPMLAERRYGTPEVTITPQNGAHIGEDIDVMVVLRPLRAVDVEKVVVQLIGYDVTRHRDDDDREREQEWECFSREKAVELGPIAARKRKVARVALPVPKVWPSIDGKLRWRVRVKVAYRGASDWDDEWNVGIVNATREGPASD